MVLLCWLFLLGVSCADESRKPESQSSHLIGIARRVRWGASMCREGPFIRKMMDSLLNTKWLAVIECRALEAVQRFHHEVQDELCKVDEVLRTHFSDL